MAARPKRADPRPAPRLALVTPRLADTTAFVAALDPALAAADIAAVIVRLAPADERTLVNRIKALAPVVQNRNAALIVGDADPGVVARGGADGVHVRGLETLGDALERLKPERIVGLGGLGSRHDAMVGAERGADYVMFGEPDDAGTRPRFAAIEERVAWWAEVFEVPCVGYAGSAEEVAPLAVAGAEFVALGDWLWRDEAGAAALIRAAAARLLPEAVG